MSVQAPRGQIYFFPGGGYIFSPGADIFFAPGAAYFSIFFVCAKRSACPLPEGPFSWFVGWLRGWRFGGMVSSVGWVDWFAYLVGWFTWLVGWLVGRLAVQLWLAARAHGSRADWPFPSAKGGQI